MSCCVLVMVMPLGFILILLKWILECLRMQMVLKHPLLKTYSSINLIHVIQFLIELIAALLMCAILIDSY